MSPITVFVLIPFAGMVLLPFLRMKWKGILTLALLAINVVISSYLAVGSLCGESNSLILPGSYVTGPIPIRIDALSGWFMLIINLIFLTGALYGYSYLRTYKKQQNNLTLHSITFLLQHASIVSICVIQNSFVFLIAILLISTFVVRNYP